MKKIFIFACAFAALLASSCENKEILTAKVTQVRQGGFSVNVDEARVFIPASLISDTYEKDLNKYADQEIEFIITEFNPRRHRIIGDRKQFQFFLKSGDIHFVKHDRPPYLPTCDYVLIIPQNAV